jgi:hypothetical protein
VDEARANRAVVARPIPIHWSGLGGGALGWLVASAAFLTRFHGSGLAVVGGLDGVLIVAVGLLVLVLRPRQYVAVEGTALRVRGLMGAKSFERNDLSKVVQLDVRISGARGRAARPAWLVLDRSGTVVVKLNRRAWNPEELDRVRRELGLDGETISGEHDAQAVNESFPRTLYWWTLHPNQSGALVVAMIIGIGLLIHFAA